MDKKYFATIAGQLGIKLSRISFVDGRSLGCLGAHLLVMSTKEERVDVLIFQHDLENLEKGFSCDDLEVRIRKALLRLNKEPVL